MPPSHRPSHLPATIIWKPVMKTIALAASLSVATCLSLLACGSATAQDSRHRVRINDLDLATAEGADAFDARVQRAARSACQGLAPLAAIQCRTAVAREFENALPEARRDNYARARSGGRILAWVPNFQA